LEGAKNKKMGRVFLLCILLTRNLIVASEHASLTGPPTAPVPAAFGSCAQVARCGENASWTEVDRMECVAGQLFRPAVPGEELILHDTAPGWGNAIRSLPHSAALASSLGRRVRVVYPHFERTFLPPHSDEAAWGAPPSDERPGACVDLRPEHEQADFRRWFREASQGRVDYPTGRLSLTANGNPTFLSDCLRAALPRFFACVQPTDAILDSVPVFYGLVARPSPVLVHALQNIRESVDPAMRPHPEEPRPGAWGLRSTHNFILALHFRGLPIGFEPMAPRLASRGPQLETFWAEATRAATKARAVAACKGQALLIYFATDDPATLRREAERRLARYGRVVFGLDARDVGHSWPTWTPEARQEVARAQANASFALDLAREKNKEHQAIHAPPRDAADEERQGTMALVEWWVLAQAQWLLTNGGTSFADTAAAVGLGPRGNMARYDALVEVGPPSSWVVRTVLRRDWAKNPCAPDPAAAANALCSMADEA
jgi:hypothetical protein